MPYKAIRLIIFIHLILFASMWNTARAQQEEKVDDIKGKTLTLEACIRIAVERHPDIRSKIAEVNAGKYTYTEGTGFGGSEGVYEYKNGFYDNNNTDWGRYIDPETYNPWAFETSKVY